MSDVGSELEVLLSEYRSCTLCHLSRVRRGVIPGRWGLPGGLVLVTDRVSSYDEAAGGLFSGPIGVLTDKILAAPKVEIPREHVSVVSCVLCRGPYGRPPRPHEVRACRARLSRELALLEPRVIVALGRRALASVAGGEGPGPGPWDTTVPELGCPVFLTTHPRDALWGDDGEIRGRKRRMYDDWQAISARYRDLSSE